MTTEVSHAEREVTYVRQALHVRFDHLLPAAEVDRIVDSVAQQYLAHPVLDFVGILVECGARAELHAMAPAAARELTPA